jgi:hypothetical protein
MRHDTDLHTGTMIDEQDGMPPTDRDAIYALAPRLLLALAGACTLSGLLGFTMLIAGAGPPPLPLLLAPPAIVLLAAPWIHLRRRSAGSDD